VKIAVVTFPGSNCDEDAAYVSESLLGSKTVRVWHKESSLPEGTDLVILPGGFSYGDALRSGALARFSPVMGAVKGFAERGGLVLGICNGFQILLEAGLLPGAMLQNASQKFVCRWVKIKAHDTDSPFSRGLGGRSLSMPVAHHEGRYHADPETLDRLFQERRVAFTYEGHNPNGAARDIAGILSANKNVLGLMPHPERAAEKILGGEDGLGLFLAARAFLEAR
jgi:phosphoribosylformylglycinamidine synthase